MTLLERIQQDSLDEQSWEEFVQYYDGYIYIIIRNFNLSPELCEELLQDILVRIWKAIPRFEYRPSKCRFRTWLALICKNTVRNYLESKAAKTSQREIEYEEALHSIDRISDPEIEKLAQKEWEFYIANLAWENIKGDFSDKVRAVFEASLSETANSQIAIDVGISESSVRVYKKRARNSLFKEILRLNNEMDT